MGYDKRKRTRQCPDSDISDFDDSTQPPTTSNDTPQHFPRRPRWLSWMRRPTGDQEVAGSTPAEVGNILSWRLIMKYFLRSFSPFR